MTSQVLPGVRPDRFLEQFRHGDKLILSIYFSFSIMLKFIFLQMLVPFLLLSATVLFVRVPLINSLDETSPYLAGVGFTIFVYDELLYRQDRLLESN